MDYFLANVLISQGADLWQLRRSAACDEADLRVMLEPARWTADLPKDRSSCLDPGRRISGGTITREALVHDNRWERKYRYVCTTVTGGTVPGLPPAYA